MTEWWNKYVGIPFVEKGRDKKGVDCWGLVRLVHKEELEIWLPTELDYESSKDYANTSRLIERAKTGLHWLEIPAKHKADFDVVSFRIGKVCGHVGIVCNEGQHFLHAIDGVNSVIERLDSLRWESRIDGYWRFYG